MQVWHENCLLKVLDRPPSTDDFVVFLSSDTAPRRQDFVSESIKLAKLHVTWHRCHIALLDMARVVQMDRANALHLTEILIFDFIEDDLNVSGSEIYFVNNKQF